MGASVWLDMIYTGKAMLHRRLGMEATNSWLKSLLKTCNVSLTDSQWTLVVMQICRRRTLWCQRRRLLSVWAMAGPKRHHHGTSSLSLNPLLQVKHGVGWQTAPEVSCIGTLRMTRTNPLLVNCT